MPGLLDFGTDQSGGLLGGLFSDPGARIGLSLLAASSPKLRGLADVMAQQDRAQQQAFQQKYIQSQIDENASQTKVREQQMKAAMDKQAWEQAYYFGEQNPNAQGAGFISPTGAAGAGGASVAGGGPVSGGGMPSGGKFEEWSRLYGIPKDALISDWRNNGGKGIPEMLMKRGAPDMQVTNGYAYDKNRLGAGYLPQLNISNDGKATQVQIAPDGLPVVSAPRGAPETYGTYQNIQANVGAANDLVTLNLPTGPVQVTRAQALAMTQGQAPQAPASMIGGGQNLTPQLRDLIAQDAAANGIANPVTNFQGAGRGQAYGVT
ncbi:MAG: hypothetical protein ING37_02340, partial [Rhodocyclaceae bacterium]|nr:hypothetical protein [Rhodocyclaceae bacterium]